jgi:signal transduction histidine kinase
MLVVFFSMVCSSGSYAEERELRSVKLQLKWTHQFQFAGYYMAQQLGYYREAGLDVEMLPGGPATDVADRVLSGQADFGTGTSDLLLDYAEGKPVMVLGVVYQHSPLVLIMRSDKPSSTLQDLPGHPLLVEEHSADISAMFSRAGLPLDELDVTCRSGSIEPFLKEEAFAISAYLTDEPFTLNQSGIDHFIFSPRAYGIDFYGDNFFTTTQRVEEDTGLVKGFREATIRGWQAALADPERAIDLILEHYPAEKSREQLVYEARITKDLMTRLVTPGYMLPGRWEHIADTYIEVGMLDERPDLSGFVFQPEHPVVLPVWFWKAVPGAVALLVLVTAAALYFRTINLRLRAEVEKRREIEHRLVESNQEMTRAKETAEEASRKMTWFISNVSHDLRAPISSMIGLSNIFRHHSKNLNLPERFNTFLEQLHSGGEFLMLMLNNILDLSALEMNEAVVRPEPIVVSEWGGSIANLVRPMATERSVEVSLRTNPERATIQADRMRLSQILLNLSHNAIKFSPKHGTVFITLTCEADALRMEVRDEGPGIPEEEQEHIFEMFSQGAEGPSHRSGTGLGLSIVERNTHLLHGTIQVGNAEPTGTMFTVNIPLNAEPAADAAAEGSVDEGV